MDERKRADLQDRIDAAEAKAVRALAESPHAPGHGASFATDKPRDRARGAQALVALPADSARACAPPSSIDAVLPDDASRLALAVRSDAEARPPLVAGPGEQDGAAATALAADGSQGRSPGCVESLCNRDSSGDAQETVAEQSPPSGTCAMDAGSDDDGVGPHDTRDASACLALDCASLLHGQGAATTLSAGKGQGMVNMVNLGGASPDREPVYVAYHAAVQRSQSTNEFVFDPSQLQPVTNVRCWIEGQLPDAAVHTSAPQDKRTKLRL